MFDLLVISAVSVVGASYRYIVFILFGLLLCCGSLFVPVILRLLFVLVVFPLMVVVC